MTARERLDYWQHRLRVRRARYISFAAKKRYWKARWRKLRKTDDMDARQYAAAMVRHYDDRLDEVADLWERAQRGRDRAEKALAGDLTEHFSVREFDTKDGTPVPLVAYPGLKALCEDVLEPLRAKFGTVRVTSGYRHREYNRRIGGAQFSQHIYDASPASVAADVWCERGIPAEWAAFVRSLRAGGTGEYRASRFVHGDNGPVRVWRGN